MQTYINDIRPRKMSLRAKAKEYRFSLSAEEKQRLDLKIYNKFDNLWSFRQAKTLLVYVSTAIEVDTYEIIKRAWTLGKTVAVPKCTATTKAMDFYIINSFEQLSDGLFGVSEPEPDKCEKLTDFSDSLCVVPALMFDKNGYRLGYGQGYYDRFLSQYEGSVIGLCYSECVADDLPHGKYDRCIRTFLTENRIYSID